MKKFTVIPVLLLMMIFIVQFAFAVPAAPSPTCGITATVVRFDMLRNDIEGLGQPPRKDFDYYNVTLNILNISTYQQEGGSSCDNSYIEFAEKTGQVLTLTEFNKNQIQADQKIKAKIRFQGDEWFNGYYLYDIQILSYGEGKEIPIGRAVDKNMSYWTYGLLLLVFVIVIMLYIVLKKRNK